MLSYTQIKKYICVGSFLCATALNVHLVEVSVQKMYLWRMEIGWVEAHCPCEVCLHWVEDIMFIYLQYISSQLQHWWFSKETVGLREGFTGVSAVTTWQHVKVLHLEAILVFVNLMPLSWIFTGCFYALYQLCCHFV